ncbi:MAG: hypothetical protein AMJ95_02365 [Omnitrophica WOR_2 bacterium SM23_72]|nr:MAG: hypothetical protein AMJ95_02365 [Omnitrophica WOR_2 bacterium SM23_72]
MIRQLNRHRSGWRYPAVFCRCGFCYNLNYFMNKHSVQPDSYYCKLFRYKTKLMIAMMATINAKNPKLPDEVLIPQYYAKRGKRR